MKIALLLSDIQRHVWALEPRLALSFGPLISDIISGKKVEADIEKEGLGFFAASENGKTYNIFDEAPEGSTAIIPIKGVMRKYDGWCSYGTESISAVVSEATQSKNIESIILDIDSGGGSVDAIAPLTQAIEKAQKAGKPVIAMCDLAASAAYYVASACDSIIANNDISAEFGSIGVMVSFMDMKPYYEKMGVKLHTVYAPESTHKNLPLENALNDDYTSLKEDVLSPLAKKFQNAVKQNRAGVLKEDTEGILNGKMFFAKDALKYGLIDKIGNMETAMKEAKKLAIANQFNNQKKQ